jgi:hypothetical protein
MRTFVAIAIAVGLSSCNTNVVLPPLPTVDAVHLPLPRTDLGTLVMIEVQRARLEYDPTVRDPITAVATCADLITYCYAPGQRSLDVCIHAVPSCGSPQPWNETVPCCPSACRDAYDAARHAGTASLAAYDRVYLAQPDCFPGVSAALMGGP